MISYIFQLVKHTPLRILPSFNNSYIYRINYRDFTLTRNEKNVFDHFVGLTLNGLTAVQTFTHN